MSGCTRGMLVLFAAVSVVACNVFAEAITGCDGAGVDDDGDGLDACVEACIGTSNLLMDSDFDGMADNFEYHHGLDPLIDDGSDDADGDDIVNLDEYMLNADPSNPASPDRTYFVTSGGSDTTGLGTSIAPWGTIGAALDHIRATSPERSRVIVGEGVYNENVSMTTNTTLAGARGASATIIGEILGADGAALENLTLMPHSGQTVLLQMDDVAMELNGVVFEGSVDRDVTGVLLDGSAPARAIFERCIFTSLGVGMDIGGAIPAVRRCTFSDIPAEFGDPARPGAGIIIRANDLSTAGEKSMGNESEPNEGWNDFMASIEGFAVINQRDEVVPMQSNYWGTVDPAEFPNRVSGAAVVLPVLVQSSAVLASSLFCTVWDSSDQKRLGSAAISLSISAFDDVTQNQDGVYAFPVVSEGQYRVLIKAPGYDSQEREISLSGGELKSLTFALAPRVPGGSGSDGETISKGCALVKGSSTTADQGAQGDAGLMAIVLAAMLSGARTRRRRLA